MRITLIILSLLLALPAIALGQEEIGSQALKIKLNDFYSIRFKQISEDEYTHRKQASEHLRHKPYKVITDIAEAQKKLGRRFRVVDVKEEEGGSRREYRIVFKDGVEKRLDEDYSFVAYYPQLEILLFEGGHSSDQPFDLNDSNNTVLFTNDFPYGVRIGNPYYHSVSPNKQFRINGFHDGQDCLVRFLEKWNKAKKKYELVGYFHGYEHNIYAICWIFDCVWTDDNKAIYSNQSGRDAFYEMEIVAN